MTLLWIAWRSVEDRFHTVSRWGLSRPVGMLHARLTTLHFNALFLPFLLLSQRLYTERLAIVSRWVTVHPWHQRCIAAFAFPLRCRRCILPIDLVSRWVQSILACSLLRDSLVSGPAECGERLAYCKRRASPFKKPDRLSVCPRVYHPAPLAKCVPRKIPGIAPWNPRRWLEAIHLQAAFLTAWRDHRPL